MLALIVVTTYSGAFTYYLEPIQTECVTHKNSESWTFLCIVLIRGYVIKLVTTPNIVHKKREDNKSWWKEGIKKEWKWNKINWQQIYSWRYEIVLETVHFTHVSLLFFIELRFLCEWQKVILCPNSHFRYLLDLTIAEPGIELEYMKSWEFK